MTHSFQLNKIILKYYFTLDSTTSVPFVAAAPLELTRRQNNTMSHHQSLNDLTYDRYFDDDRTVNPFRPAKSMSSLEHIGVFFRTLQSMVRV